MRKVRVCRPDQCQEGSTIKFEFQRQEKKVAAFLARVNGKFIAYENECRHIPLPLDYADNEFFSNDGRYFICRTHGALYEPLTGECIEGPCQGRSLKPLDLKVEADMIWVLEPNAAPGSGAV